MTYAFLPVPLNMTALEFTDVSVDYPSVAADIRQLSPETDSK